MFTLLRGLFTKSFLTKFVSLQIGSIVLENVIAKTMDVDEPKTSDPTFFGACVNAPISEELIFRTGLLAPNLWFFSSVASIVSHIDSNSQDKKMQVIANVQFQSLDSFFTEDQYDPVFCEYEGIPSLFSGSYINIVNSVGVIAPAILSLFKSRFLFPVMCITTGASFCSAHFGYDIEDKEYLKKLMLYTPVTMSLTYMAVKFGLTASILFHAVRNFIHLMM